MLSGWSLWQDPGFLGVYAKCHGYGVDVVGGVYVLVSGKRFWRRQSSVNADVVVNLGEIWAKHPNTVIKTYTEVSGLKNQLWHCGTYLMDLKGDYAGGFSKKCRGHIREAEASGQSVGIVTDSSELREWHRLYARVGRKKGFRVHGWGAVRSLWDSPYGLLLTTRLDGVLTGGLFLLLNGKVAMEWLGAVDSRVTYLSPNSLLHPYAFKHLGGRVYDFGGTILDTGVDQFKRGFGGEYAQLYEYRSNEK